MGCPKHPQGAPDQTRPDHTRLGLGFDPCGPTRFANPDQTETHSLGKDARPRHKTDASLARDPCPTGQGCIETDSPLRPGRPYLDRGELECNNTYPYRLASAVSKMELCLFTHSGCLGHHIFSMRANSGSKSDHLNLK